MPVEPYRVDLVLQKFREVLGSGACSTEELWAKEL